MCVVSSGDVCLLSYEWQVCLWVVGVSRDVWGTWPSHIGSWGGGQEGRFLCLPPAPVLPGPCSPPSVGGCCVLGISPRLRGDLAHIWLGSARKYLC